jgi:hypothetical protein
MGQLSNPIRSCSGRNPLHAHATKVNKVCLSGLSAIIEATRMLRLCSDWDDLVGVPVQLHPHGKFLRSGVVDARHAGFIDTVAGR